jgi:hypothetical protein
LAKLLGANLLAVEKQGRHRYYRLASAQVARTLESVMALTLSAPPRHRAKSRTDEELRAARMCYDHVAGRIGVAIADSLLARGHIAFEGDSGEVTDSGRQFFAELGVGLTAPTKSRRVYCRSCLDWSERRPHIAGHVGAQIANFCFERKWFARNVATRALTITGPGCEMLPRAFGVDLREGSL